jgi:hypothetical protein
VHYILVEHQSTVNENMPLRFLFYIARVFERIIDGEAIFRQRLAKIPTPEFIVVYNGDSDMPERSVLKLSDAFKAAPKFRERGMLELEVVVYNVNMGHNAELVNRSETLDGYIRFIDKVKRYIAAGCERTEAFARAIRECIDEGILADYFRKNGSEVVNMLTQEWSLEKAMEVRYKEGMEEGEERGMARGMAQANLETARRLLGIGLKIEDISMSTGLSVDTVRTLRQ